MKYILRALPVYDEAAHVGGTCWQQFAAYSHDVLAWTTVPQEGRPGVPGCHGCASFPIRGTPGYGADLNTAFETRPIDFDVLVTIDATDSTSRGGFRTGRRHGGGGSISFGEPVLVRHAGATACPRIDAGGSMPPPPPPL